MRQPVVSIVPSGDSDWEQVARSMTCHVLLDRLATLDQATRRLVDVLHAGDDVTPDEITAFRAGLVGLQVPIEEDIASIFHVEPYKGALHHIPYAARPTSCPECCDNLHPCTRDGARQ